MEYENPKVGYDVNGIWREDGENMRMDFPWEEITQIQCWPLDCIYEVRKAIEVVHTSAHSLEFYDDYEGFEELFIGINKYMKGVKEGWQEEFKNMGKDTPKIAVWEKNN